MYHKYTENDRARILSSYWNDVPISELSIRSGVSKSTLYHWVAQSKKQSDNQSTVWKPKAQKEITDLKRRSDKMAAILEVIDRAGIRSMLPLEDKLVLFDEMKDQYSARILCSALGISRGTYSNRIVHQKNPCVYVDHRERMKELIKDVFDNSEQRFGADKILAALSDQGVHTSKKLILKLMHEMGLQSFGVNAKKEYRASAPKENILQRHFDVTAPNMVWVSDMTQFRIQNASYFICVVLDLFSRRVLAYKIGLNATTQLVVSTFKAAFENRGCPQGLTFHSDQGTQCASFTFHKLLADCRVMQSFSNAGQPHDNAVAESFFALLKKEELYRRIYKSDRELRESVERYMTFYNTERPHRYNQYRSPAAAEAAYWTEHRQPPAPLPVACNYKLQV